MRQKKLLYALVIILLLAAVFLLMRVSTDFEADCKAHSTEDCPADCVVCPPCEACSSISCQTEEFCKGIGFNRSWFNEIKDRQRTLTGKTI